MTPVRRVRRAPFSLRLAGVLIVLGAVVAGIAVAIPLAATQQQTRQSALDRSADRGALALDLLDAEEASLQGFAQTVAARLPVAATDTPDFLDTISRGTPPGDVVAVVAGSTTDAHSAGTVALSPSPALLRTSVADRGKPTVRRDRAAPYGTWILVSALLTDGRAVVVGRPLASSEFERLASAKASSTSGSGLVVVSGGHVVLPGTIEGRTVATGSGLPDGLLQAATSNGPSAIVRTDTDDVGAVSAPLPGGELRLLSTAAVSAESAVVGAIAIPVVLACTVIIGLALIIVFVLVDRDLQRPLRRLEMAVTAMTEQDDFAVPVQGGGTEDGVTRLAASFDAMRLELRAMLDGAEARAEIAADLSATAELAVALDGVCRRLTTSTGASAAMVMLVADGAVRVHTAGIEIPRERALGLVAAGALVPLAAGASGPMIACPRPGTEESQIGWHEICAAPIVMAGHRLGVVAVADAPNHFDRHDLELVGVVAEQVGLAVERERVLELARIQANTDVLTGLHNRRFLAAHLDQVLAIADRTGTPTALLMIDVDNFKTVNDTHGHEVGDLALRAIANTLQGRLRRSDLAARLGGDEFVVVMPETDRGSAIAVADVLRASVAAGGLIAPDGTHVPLALSVGVAVREPGTVGVDRLLTIADGALYNAKRAGRNRVRVARPEAATAETPATDAPPATAEPAPAPARGRRRTPEAEAAAARRGRRGAPAPKPDAALETAAVGTATVVSTPRRRASPRGEAGTERPAPTTPRSRGRGAGTSPD